MPVYTNPATVLCRLVLLDEPTGKGWTETMWLPGLGVLNKAAQIRAGKWVDARCRLLAPGIRPVRAMVSLDGPFQDELPVDVPGKALPIPGSKIDVSFTRLFAASEEYGMTDVPWNTLKMSGYSSNGLYQDRRELSGVPDSVTIIDGVVKAGVWWNWWLKYTYLLSGNVFLPDGNVRAAGVGYPPNQFGFPVTLKPADGNLWYPISGCGFDSPGVGLRPHLYVMAPGTPITADDVVYVGQVKGSNTLPNGQHVVYRVVGNKIYLDTPPTVIASVYRRGGYIHLVKRQVKSYYQVTLDGLSRRKRGAGYSRGAGRNRTRASVPSISNLR